MALTDDVPVKITSPDYRPAGQGALEQWLAKEAEALETNEDSKHEPVKLHDDPPAHKGPPTGKPEPFHQNEATYAESKEDRQEVTRQAFNNYDEAERHLQELLGANLDHAKSGDFTSHGVLLQSKTMEGSTLDEMVRKLFP